MYEIIKGLQICISLLNTFISDAFQMWLYDKTGSIDLRFGSSFPGGSEESACNAKVTVPIIAHVNILTFNHLPLKNLLPKD